MLKLFAKIYFGILIIFSIYSCIFVFIYKYKRSSLKEIADYEWCPFWKEIQYDMGLITEYNLYFNGKPNVMFNKHPKNILDIGSGSGVTSALILRKIFGDNVKITLSDINPNIESWKKIKNINYLDNPINIINDKLDGYSMISLINSLHHLDENVIEILFRKAKSAKSDLFIMDAKRLSPIHPLLIPNLYFIIYVILTIIGIIKIGEICELKSLIQIIIEPWIMSMDQMIGSMRRYHKNIIYKFAIKFSYKMYLREDNLMNYIILENL